MLRAFRAHKMIVLIAFCCCILLGTSCDTEKTSVILFEKEKTNQLEIATFETSFQNASFMKDFLTLEELRRVVGCTESKYSGKGIVIAIIDSGIVPHADITQPQNRILTFKDFVNDKLLPYDDYGHGTAMAGIIAGNGYSSNGRNKGIAPECDIVAVKVLDKFGETTIKRLATAIDWVRENKEKLDISIVNISIGVPYSQTAYQDLQTSIERACAEGLLLVASAGNDFSKNKRVFLPAAFESVVAVGAIEDTIAKNPWEYQVARFSAYWDSKPDLVSPGSFVLTLSKHYDYSLGYIDYDDSFGTSNAAAVTSGIAALLKQQNPNLTANELKQQMWERCIKLKGEDVPQGYGFLYLGNLKTKGN